MNILTIVQVVLSLLLIGAILLQQKGSGLGSTFGSEGGNLYSTKRGVEKILFYATIVLAIAFFAIAILRVRV
ncbi:MAG: preprotein translocase subunit SecG [bacterium]|nr:preprotein translocase subunit SecG [bacterium]